MFIGAPSTKQTTKKRVGLQRLENTIDNAKQMQNLMREKNDMKKKHYEEKEKYMRQDLEIKNTMVTLLQKICDKLNEQ